MTEAKPYQISKPMVWEAYRRVKANGGAAGVDAQSVEDFEVHLGDNLYKLRSRLAHYRLELHPEKTKIVYCKDGNRTEEHEHTLFVFLGYEFRSRQCKSGKGQFFVGFTPAVSPKAKKSMSQAIREWNLISHTTETLSDLAVKINPVVRGWMNYYGVYCRSELSSTLRQIELSLTKWAMRKYKKLHRRFVAGTRLLSAIRRREPKLFAHWAWNMEMAER